MSKRILSIILISIFAFIPLEAFAIKYKGDLETNESVTFPEQVSTPGNPAATKYKLYFKNDGNVYKLNSGGTEEQVDGGGGSGDVVGPASSTDTAIARFDGATGLLLQDSPNTTINTQSHFKLFGANAAIDMVERTTGPSFQVGRGHFWVKDDAPSVAKFTDDAGTDFDIVRPLASQAEAEAGVENTKGMTPLRTKQAIDALGAGDVVGPASSTDNAIVRFDLATGKLVQDSVNTTLSDQSHLELKGTTAAIDMVERAAQPTPVAGRGHFWIKNDAPSTAYFTDDAGTDFQLGVASGSGDVVGPASSTDNAIVRFDSTTGKLVQDSVNTTLGDQSHLELKGTAAAIDMVERAAQPTPVAGRGHFWIKSDTPSTAYFTDDAGTDFQLGAGGVAIWTDSGSSIEPANDGRQFVLTNSSGLQGVRIHPWSSPGAVFNEQGHSLVDFRVESDTQTQAFFVDSSADTVGMFLDLEFATENSGGKMTFVGEATTDATTPAANNGVLYTKDVGAETHLMYRNTTEVLDISAGAAPAIGKNYIWNGGVDIWFDSIVQNPVSTSKIIMEGWRWDTSGTGTVSYSQSTTGTPVGIPYVMAIDPGTTDTSIAAGDYYRFEYDFPALDTIDLKLGTADAKTVTISFQMRSPTTANYSLALLNSAKNRSYVTEFSVATTNTWEDFSFTIPLDTSGTWVNSGTGIGLRMIITYACGTDSDTATLDSWTATGDSCSSTNGNHMGSALVNHKWVNFKMEEGSTATRYERRTIQEEDAKARTSRFPISDLQCVVTVVDDTLLCVLPSISMQKQPRSTVVTAKVGNFQGREMIASPTLYTSAWSNGTVSWHNSGAGYGGYITITGFSATGTAWAVGDNVRLDQGNTSGNQLLLDASYDSSD